MFGEPQNVIIDIGEAKAKGLRLIDREDGRAAPIQAVWRQFVDKFTGDRKSGRCNHYHGYEASLHLLMKNEINKNLGSPISIDEIRIYGNLAFLKFRPFESSNDD